MSSPDTTPVSTLTNKETYLKEIPSSNTQNAPPQLESHLVEGMEELHSGRERGMYHLAR